CVVASYCRFKFWHLTGETFQVLYGSGEVRDLGFMFSKRRLVSALPLSFSLTLCVHRRCLALLRSCLLAFDVEWRRFGSATLDVCDCLLSLAVELRHISPDVRGLLRRSADEFGFVCQLCPAVERDALLCGPVDPGYVLHKVSDVGHCRDHEAT